MITNKIVAIEFDGVIVARKPVPTASDIKPNCADALQTIASLGNKIVVYSCRKGAFLKMAVQFLIDNVADLPYNVAMNGKPNADYYIDDRALCVDYKDNMPINVNNVDWAKIKEFFLRAK